MPVDETNDNVHNLFEQESLSQRVHSQFSGGSHSLLNSNLWFNSQRQGTFPQYCQIRIGHPSDFGKVFENGREQHAFKASTISNFTHSAAESHSRDLNRILQVSQSLVSRPYQSRSEHGDLALDGCESAFRNNASSESQKASENVSGSTRPFKNMETADFDFIARQCQLMKSQQPGMSQSQARPLSGFSDMKLLQQQYFYKQLQEIRQHQLQQLEHEPGQQNPVGQFSAFAKQVTGDQATAVVSGTPMYDTYNYMWSGERMPQSDVRNTNSGSQTFMLGNSNMVRTGSSLQEQAHAFNSMGLMPQPAYSASLGGTRDASGKPVNPFPNLQWGAQENIDMFTRSTGNQNQKTGMQSSAFDSFYGDQSASFSGQVSASDGLSISKQSFHGRNVIGQVSNALESVNSALRAGNFQQGSSLTRNCPVQEFQRQEHDGLLGNMEEKLALQTATPQGSISLDPLEEKIFYGGDSCAWSPAHGEQPLSNAFSRVGSTSAVSLGQGNHLEGSDSFNKFPSVQSGSWSALILSTVAEASSSDTGMQDEWSGLSYQKAEVSTGNPSEINDNWRQGVGWNVLKPIQSANSLSSKPVHLIDDVNMASSSNSAGFQQMTPTLAFEKSGQAANDVQCAHGFVNSDCSSESLKRSPKAGRWLERKPEERTAVDRTVHTPVPLGNSSGGSWRSQTYGRQESVHPEAIDFNALNMQSTWTRHQQPSMITYQIDGQSISKMNGWNMNESLPSDGDNLQDDANNLRPSHNNEPIVAMQLGRGCDVNVWQIDTHGSMQKNENQGWSSIPNFSIRLEQAKSPSGSPEVRHDGASGSWNINLDKTQRVPDSCHFDNSSSSNMGSEDNVAKYHFHLNQHTSTNHATKLGDSHENSKERCYMNATPTEVHASNHFRYGQQAAEGDVLMDNTWSSAKDSPTLAAGSQKSSAHVVRKSSTGGRRRFLYHPMGELAVDVPQPSISKHDVLSQGPQHSAIGEKKFLELGHMSQAKSTSFAAGNTTANSGKGFFGSISQNRSKGPEDAPSKAVGYHAAPASFFDGLTNYPPKETSQNMLELLNKVDHSIVNAAKPLGSSSYNPSLEVSETVTSGQPSGHMRSNQSYSSQGFGLHLAPPSGASAVLGHVFPSRNVNDDNSRNIILEEGKGQTWLHGQTSLQSLLHPSEKSQQEKSCDKTAATDTTAVADTGHEFSSISHRDTRLQSTKTLMDTAESHYIKNQLHSQQSSGVSGQTTREESLELAYGSQVLNRQANLESNSRQNHDSQDGHSVKQQVPTLEAEAASKPNSFDTNTQGESDFTSGIPFFARDNSVTNFQTLPSTSANSSYIQNSNQHHTSRSASISQVSNQQGILQPNRFSPLLHNAWSNMSARISVPRVPQMISRGPLKPISPTTTWVVHAVNDQNGRDRGGTSVSELCPNSKSMQHLASREDHQSREIPSQHIPSNKPLPMESFGHENLAGSHVHGENQGSDSSLPSKTDNTSFQSAMESGAGSQPNYSLLQQMEAMKKSESDPNSAVKRLRGENDADVSQVASRIGQRNVYGYSASNINLTENSLRTMQHAPYPVLDGKNPSFSMEESKNRSANASAHSLSSNTHAQDMAGFDRNKSQNYPAGRFTLTPPHPSLRGAGHSHLNSQMANSWFEQFGTYKNGQFITTSDRFAIPQNSAKAAAQQFFFGRVSENTRSHAIVEQRSFSDVSQVGSVTSMPISTTMAAAKDHPSLVQVSQPDANSQVQVLVKQKKRKTLNLEVLPWHKMVTHTSRSLQSISFAELRWASATNRQREKIDDQAEMIDDILLTSGPRSRIIFTTQLMQKILCSLPAALLSRDANSVYEIATYILAKLSLGDACSLVSSLVAALQVNDEKDSKISLQTGSFRRLTARCLSEIVGSFVDKAGKLESDFLRLEKGPSLLDIRVECRDLERFSIINRFARFHGRGPADGTTRADSSSAGPAAAPSSLDAGSLMPERLSPQRYVTAVPMPKSRPEGLQCHSL